jgi:hypothetical protein
VNTSQKHWDDLLAAEGMPAEPLRTWMDNLTLPSLFDGTPHSGQGTIADSERYQYWTQFTHAVTALPADYPQSERAFLVKYANVGYIGRTEQAKARYGISRMQARTILEKFAKHQRELEATE